MYLLNFSYVDNQFVRHEELITLLTKNEAIHFITNRIGHQNFILDECYEIRTNVIKNPIGENIKIDKPEVFVCELFFDSDTCTFNIKRIDHQ